MTSSFPWLNQRDIINSRRVGRIRCTGIWKNVFEGFFDRGRFIRGWSNNCSRTNRLHGYWLAIRVHQQYENPIRAAGYRKLLQAYVRSSFFFSFSLPFFFLFFIRGNKLIEKAISVIYWENDLQAVEVASYTLSR